MESLVTPSRPRVDIELAGQETGFVPSYSTWDTIEGTATVAADRDTSFDDIDITLEGTVKASVERDSMAGRADVSHTLLKLRQTVDDAAYPTPRVLRSGHSYRFPFTFVVPDRLLPQVCKHAKGGGAGVGRAHTLLPPSLGDPMVAGNGRSLLDDMCSEMCRVGYQVRVGISRRSSAQGKGPKSLASVGKKVRIIPAVEEEPPLDVSDHRGMYWDRKEKDVRRGLMRARFGRITAEASQPKPIQLLPRACQSDESVGTVATVHLRFDPVGDEEPPRLSTLSSKLRVSTLYTSQPMDGPPSQAIRCGQLGREVYVDSVPLSSRCVASASWTKHTAATRRRSIESAASCQSSASSSVGAGGTFYASSIVVPVALPRNKAFVPTFDSCIMSRFYALDLGLSYRTPSTNIMTPSISLRIPIQLTCRSKGGGGAGPRLDDTKEEVDEIFSPHRVAPPSPQAPAANAEDGFIRGGPGRPDGGDSTR